MVDYSKGECVSCVNMNDEQAKEFQILVDYFMFKHGLKNDDETMENLNNGKSEYNNRRRNRKKN